MSYFDLEEFEREAKLLEVMPGRKHFFYLSRPEFRGAGDLAVHRGGKPGLSRLREIGRAVATARRAV